MNILKRLIAATLAALLGAIMLTGCAMDNYETVPEKTKRVSVIRYHAHWERESGLAGIKVFSTGKWSHGNGPSISYDFDTSIQRYKIEDMEVKTLDNINLPTKIEIAYRVIPTDDAVLIAALHYLPGDMYQNSDGSRFVPSGFNKAQILDVSIEEIFKRNILPYADEISRDCIDSNASKDIKRSALEKQILRALNLRLARHQIPKIAYTDDGIVFPDVQIDKNGKMLYDGPKVCITDVIEIQRVTVEYSNPTFINKEINKIGELKADVQKARGRLKQWEVKTNTRMKEAENARQTAANIGETLKANPYMHAIQRRNNLKTILKNAKPGMKTKVTFVPEEMMGNIRYNINSSNPADKTK